jgi:hypothetical protein
MPNVNVRCDDEEQLQQIQTYVILGETLYAVFDCQGRGAGFVGITDQRVIFRDYGVLLHKRVMVSVPYNRVVGAAISDADGAASESGEMTLLTAVGNFTFEFKGAEEALWAYRFIMDQILNQAEPQLRDSAGWLE